MVTQKKVILEDNFSNNENNWEQRNDSTVRLEIEDGAYLIENRHDSGSRLVISSLDLPKEVEYEIEITLQKVSGVDNYGYGLVWGVQDLSNFYTFQISNEGQYRISQLAKNDWRAYRDWTASPHVKRYNLPNKLAIRHDGQQVTFYVNEEMVDELTFPPNGFGRKLGFIVSSVMAVKVHDVIVTQYGEVTESATKESAATIAQEETLQQVLDELNNLIGLENIKEQINTFINFLKVQKEREKRGLAKTAVSLHMVLYGPPGTGKTTVARLIGRIYKQLGFLAKGDLIETDRAGLVGGYVGQTALKVDEKVKESLGGVLFIDEAYTLKPEGATSDFGQEAIDILLKRMEDHRGEIAVVIAGYPDEMERFLEANPGIKSRFSRYFFFEHYRPADLFLIFEKFCKEGHYILTESAKSRLQEVIEKAYANRDRTFGNARFARNLFEKMLEQQANRIAAVEPLTEEILNTLTADDIPPDLLDGNII